MANTKKRVLSLLMALVMTLGLLPISALADETPVVDPPSQTEEAQPAEQDPAQAESAPQDPAQAESAPQDPAQEESAPQDPAQEESAPQEPAQENPAPQEPAQENPAPQEPAQENSAEQQTPPAPVDPNTLASDRRVPTYERTLWIKLDGEWLGDAKVSIKVFDAAGTKIGSPIEKTTVNGAVSFEITSTAEPKSVEVTYQDGNKEYTTGVKPLNQYVATTLTLKRVYAEGISAADKKLLNSLADGTQQEFKVYSYYSNVVPAKIDQGFGPNDFGPSSNDTPYFTVTVNMAQLLALPGMDCKYTDSGVDKGHWYVFLDSESGMTLETFWTNVKACMNEKDAAKFDNFCNDSYRGYVLKREGSEKDPSYHMDGIFNVKLPYYVTELNLNGEPLNIPDGGTKQNMSFVKDNYLAALKKLGDGTMDWDKMDYTIGGHIYHLSKDTWPANGDEIQYSEAAVTDFYNARFYASTKEMNFAYKVQYQYEEKLATDADFRVVGTKLISTNYATTRPTEADILAAAPPASTFGEVSYTKSGTTDPATGEFGEGKILTFTVTYQHVIPVEHTVTYKWAKGSVLPQDFDKTLKAAPAPDSEIFTDWANFTLAPFPTLNEDQIDAGYLITETWYTDTECNSAYTEHMEISGTTPTLYLRCVKNAPNMYSLNYEFVTDSVRYDAETNAHPLLENILPGNKTLTLPKLKATQVKTLITPNLTAAGYSFEGWYTAAEGGKLITTLANQTGNTTLYAYFTYAEPRYTYLVGYEFYSNTNGQGWIMDGATAPADMKTETVSLSNVSTLTDGLLLNTERLFENGVRTFGKFEYQIGTNEQDSIIRNNGKELATDGRVYTIKCYRTLYTVGSLTINKTIEGLNEKARAELESKLSFTVTGPKSFTAQTIKYSDFVNGSYTIKGLAPGDYTVKENNAAVPGYTLKTIGELSAKVDAQAEPAAISITNSYESQTYTITFDAGNHGKANNVTGTDNYAWRAFTEVTGDSATESYGFAKTGNVTGAGSKIVYTIEYADYLTYQDEMSVAAPKLEADKGYTIDSGFTNDLDGQYKTLMQAMKTMVGNDKIAATYTAAYTANTDTGYTVKYFYQNADGSYNEAPTGTDSRTGTTGETAKLKPTDTAARTHGGLSYVYDASKSENLSEAIIKGEGSTVLRVFFKWQAGVTYKYVNAPIGAPDLPNDPGVYNYHEKVARRNTWATTVTNADGTWTLTWDANSLPMVSTGITFTGTWKFVPKGYATVTVNFVDEKGNPIREAMTTDDIAYGSSYDVTAANAEDMKTLVNGKYSYDFSEDYLGEFDKPTAAEVDYTGTIHSNLVITRVYHIHTTNVKVEKTYNINQLPEGFKITATSTDGVIAPVVLTPQEVLPGEVGVVRFDAQLPLGGTYTFTESGYSNGANWSTVLTAQQAEGGPAPRMATLDYTDLIVKGYSFTATVTTNDLVGDDTVMIAMHNAYSYTAPIVPPVEPDNDPDEGYGPGENPLEKIVSPEVPLAELPETEIPLTELPATEVPLAEAPATGDNLAMWIMAAAISGLSLVWLMISGKKREDENAE